MKRRTLLQGLAVAPTVYVAATTAVSAQNKIDEQPTHSGADGLDLLYDSQYNYDDSFVKKLPRKRIELVQPPFVHEHEQVTKAGPCVVEVTLPIIEKELEIDGIGTKIHALTFGGSVPGPMIVVHEGDFVEITLVNLPENTMVHNIDFHASTSAMGGGDISKVAPGEQVTIRWRAERIGVFIYHCAPGASMTPWHVVQGMNGAVMVLPRKGLRDHRGRLLQYNKIYYIGENDFYVPKDKDGNYMHYADPAASMPDTLEKMHTLTPSHIVFNGSVGALTGENALQAKVGETVMFIHSQANRDTRPHLIGGHGDYVWEHGKFANAPLRDMETWFVRGGSAGAALYTFKQPGIYAYLNHNLIEAIELGALAHVDVSGSKWDHQLMTIIEEPTEIKPETDISLPKRVRYKK